MYFFSLGILVHASKSGGKNYSYNVTSVVLCSELLKLLICSVWYAKKKSSFRAVITDSLTHRTVAVRYLITAFLYCLYNNLSFVNLANYDPTTYFILLQLRNVITGVIYQILFKKQLSRLQWISLFILTGGCIVKELGRTSDGHSVDAIFNYHLLLILLQLFCSCFAGVYNEYLLKDSRGQEVDILIQNIYLYFDSILCNILVIYFNPFGSSSSSPTALFDLSFLQTPIVWFILVNSALAGITTSFFLKSLNSILKTFAATIEIAISAIVCYFIFHIPIDIYTLTSMIIIFIAVYIYYRNPISASPTTPSKNLLPVSYKHVKTDDTEALLEDDTNSE